MVLNKLVNMLTGWSAYPRAVQPTLGRSANPGRVRNMHPAVDYHDSLDRGGSLS